MNPIRILRKLLTPEEMGDYYLVINDLLRVTPNHLVYSDGEWISADKLEIGDSLFYPSSDYRIFSIEKVFEKTDTYNFEVDGHHNYFAAMDSTNVLVHNGPAWGVSLSTVPDPPEGGAGTGELSVDFTATSYNDPFGGAITYWWNFGDGSGWDSTPTDGTNTHLYTNPPTYYCTATVRVTEEGSPQSWPPPQPYVEDTVDITVYSAAWMPPIAAFTWFDTDGPYASGTDIYFDASDTIMYPGGADPTYTWYLDNNNWTQHYNEIEFLEDAYFADGLEHKVELIVDDDLGDSTGSVIHMVQANNPDPVPPSDLWVLTSKDVYPQSGDDTFELYTADYHVDTTRIRLTNYYLFEVKEKTISDSPTLHLDKIKYLCGGSCNNQYEDIITAFGLDSEYKLYNFRIDITVYDSHGHLYDIDDPDGHYGYGASDIGSINSESTTRKVSVYFPPDDDDINLISKHPEYGYAEITLRIFLGGTPP